MINNGMTLARILCNRRLFPRNGAGPTGNTPRRGGSPDPETPRWNQAQGRPGFARQILFLPLVPRASPPGATFLGASL